MSWISKTVKRIGKEIVRSAEKVGKEIVRGVEHTGDNLASAAKLTTGVLAGDAKNSVKKFGTSALAGLSGRGAMIGNLVKPDNAQTKYWKMNGLGKVEDLSASQVRAALTYERANPGTFGTATLGKMQNLADSYQAEEDALARQEEFMMAMNESLAAMAEAQNYVPPYAQPSLMAAQDYTQAQNDTQQNQLRRRGLLSLTRFGDSSRSAFGA